MADVDARLAEEVQKYSHLYGSSLKEYCIKIQYELATVKKNRLSEPKKK